MKFQTVILCTILSVLAVTADERCTGDTVYYPSTTDCSQFYQCDVEGNPTLIQCTPGLEFNPITLVSFFFVCSYSIYNNFQQIKKIKLTGL